MTYPQANPSMLTHERQPPHGWHRLSLHVFSASFLPLPLPALYTRLCVCVCIYVRGCLCAKLRGVQDARGRRAKFSQLASEQQASLERFPLCTRTMDGWNYSECGPSISQFSAAFIPLSFARRNWTNAPLYPFPWNLVSPYIHMYTCPVPSTNVYLSTISSLNIDVRVDGYFLPFNLFAAFETLSFIHFFFFLFCIWEVESFATSFTSKISTTVSDLRFLLDGYRNVRTGCELDVNVDFSCNFRDWFHLKLLSGTVGF